MLGHKGTWEKLSDDLKGVLEKNLLQAVAEERADIASTTDELQSS